MDRDVNVLEYIANLEAENARLREALKEIAANSYGLQGLLEDNEPVEKISEYWASEACRKQQTARKALQAIQEGSEND